MKEIYHESGARHVTGECLYVDDIPVDSRLLHGHVVYSKHASAHIKSTDLSKARKLQGVKAVLNYSDIPGHNQMGPVIKDELCLAEQKVEFIGQAMFLIAAETPQICREAEALIAIEYDIKDAVFDVRNADLLGPEREIIQGNVESAWQHAAHKIKGELFTGAQEHWYLETQVCLCLPGEGHEIQAICSTQHPSETQALIADVLNIKRSEVVVQVRRMGGAFGGKETQANHIACWTALLCQATGCPVKIRLSRDDDQRMTGKRHPYFIRYRAAYENDGKIVAAEFDLNSNGGAASDLSFAILERAMLHVDNAYYIPNLKVTGRVRKTNTPSNTAFRGFGAPQAMAAIETIIDRIARQLQKDAARVREINYYSSPGRDHTHYDQTVENNHLQTIYDQLLGSSDYFKRREEINHFNTGNEFIKKGLAITPVKFGISFTTTFLNQAGALVHIYQDGTVQVNHGGTEMGQGLHTKIGQIAALELGVDISRIKVTTTDTSKVPNTSATAASAGTDLNGMAVRNAIEELKFRIAKVIAQYFSKENGNPSSSAADIRFENDMIFDEKKPKRRIPFDQAVPIVYLERESLSATGFYKTPEIGWDKASGKGMPFYYFAFGMAVTEVKIDTLSGSHEVLRTDILHDVGDSINPGIDIGQIRGGYIQGLGWCTTEECKWDAQGNLLNHSPDTYKIPTIQDTPKIFKTELLRGVPNINVIRRSKAVAEPPFMLALSAWLAIKDALSAIADHNIEPQFSLPATNEVILLSAANLREKLKRHREDAAEVEGS